MHFETNVGNKLIEDFLQSLIGMLRSLEALSNAKVELCQAETQVTLSQLSKAAEQEEAEDKTHKGQMRAPFGYCSKCMGVIVDRNRSGMDRCINGHIYPSKTSVTAREAATAGEVSNESLQKRRE